MAESAHMRATRHDQRLRPAEMEFASANPSVVRSIKQRVLLNAWLRALQTQGSLPAIADFRPEGLAD